MFCSQALGEVLIRVFFLFSLNLYPAPSFLVPFFHVHINGCAYTFHCLFIHQRFLQKTFFIEGNVFHFVKLVPQCKSRFPTYPPCMHLSIYFLDLFFYQSSILLFCFSIILLLHYTQSILIVPRKQLTRLYYFLSILSSICNSPLSSLAVRVGLSKFTKNPQQSAFFQ